MSTDKVVVIGQGGCFRESGCIRAKMVVLMQKRLYSSKVVVFGKNFLFCGKSGCIRAKLLYLAKSG